MLLCLYVISFSCNAQKNHFDGKIGQIQNGMPEFVVDTIELKNVWASTLSSISNLNLSFDKVIFEQAGEKYFLVAFEFDPKAVSTILLEIDNGYIYEACINGGGNSCTCEGCESTGEDSLEECIPTFSGLACYCTDCSKGTCKKTVTVMHDFGMLSPLFE